MRKNWIFNLFTSEENKFYPWSMLHHEGKVIIQAIERKWLHLLSEKFDNTEIYREFLARCPQMFFDGVDTTRSIIISGLELDNRCVIDFVVTENKYSLGINYHLFKVESPQKHAFSENGAISETLVNAINEVERWNRWITNNKFPYRLFPSHNQPKFTYWIIIGLESDPKPQILQHNMENIVKIASFHYFSQAIKNRHFRDIILESDRSLWENDRDLDKKNKMSNPFFKALSHKKWLKITQSGFATTHIISHNRELFLKHLEDNGLTDIFIEIWNKLPEKRQRYYFEHMEESCW